MECKIYASSDHHFGHANIIKYCNRECKDIESDAIKMIEDHNSVVSNEDIWICVGDIFCSKGFNDEKRKRILEKLNSKYKILIKGNHDHMPDQYYLDLGFDEVKNCKILKLTHKDPSQDLTKSSSTTNIVNLEKDSQDCRQREDVYVFYHYPEIPNSPNLPDNFTLVHGHTHKVIHIDDDIKRINVCIDVDPLPYRIA